jgi:septal ring factor EnvC (AmiA/AmiB activator)
LKYHQNTKELTKFFAFILSLVLFLSVPVLGQNKETLELKRKKLLEEIKFNEKQLSQTKTSIKASFEELLTLRKQISLRESLIQNTQAEVSALNNQIKKNTEVIKALEEDLRKLREQYAEVVVLSYKNQKIKQKATLILSAENFNEAFRRLNYLRKYGSYRKLQAENISALQKSIEEKNKEIEKNKQEKQLILNEQLNQKKSLDNERLAKDQIVNNLKRQERTLSDEIKRKQAEANKLNKQIEDIIRKEIEAAAKTKKATETTKAVTAVKDTPEYLALSAGFSQNKGKLPWPVEKGYLSRSFGQYSHPELKNIKLENNGIDIKTEERAAVRTIFKGKVVNVISNPVYKNAVIINHGEYFSVYSKLATVNVSPNQEVDTKSIIGTVFTDPDTKVSEVHLEIWKGAVKQNPSLWIYNK